MKYEDGEGSLHIDNLMPVGSHIINWQIIRKRGGYPAGEGGTTLLYGLTNPAVHNFEGPGVKQIVNLEGKIWEGVADNGLVMMMEGLGIERKEWNLLRGLAVQSQEWLAWQPEANSVAFGMKEEGGDVVTFAWLKEARKIVFTWLCKKEAGRYNLVFDFDKNLELYDFGILANFKFEEKDMGTRTRVVNEILEYLNLAAYAQKTLLWFFKGEEIIKEETVSTLFLK